MTLNSILQILIYLGVLLALAKPLGNFMARVYERKGSGRFEGMIYRVCGINPESEMHWKEYTWAALIFNLLGFAAVYALQRFQHLLPLNPANLPAVSPDSSFNTAISFATNTNWQGYSGEATMSYLTQMLGLGVQNFVSAATGMAVLVALARGFVRRNSKTIGNFWVDLTRSTVYILLPLSLVLALVLVQQGVVQTFDPYVTASTLDPAADGAPQTIAVGPAASQIAIKQLGTNGGGFFNVNSAHPFENPTPLSNFLEVISILVLAAALCVTFGRLVKDERQGWAILIAMFVIFIPLIFCCTALEQQGNPKFSSLNIDQSAGNMEGKEVRFGVTDSAIWATATTAASNGSVNSMHDSFTPLGGLIPMWLMQLGEVVFGGVGSGLYGMLMFAIVAVFVAGLMVGRTPEYLGKKIEAYEMKMASLVILIPTFAVLGGAAIAILDPQTAKSIANPAIHGFSEVLYAFSSAGNNNGSAFAGISANVPFYNLALGLAMFVSRYWLLVPTLAIAGSLAAKKYTPPGSGTLPTHSTLFILLLVSTVLIVGALTFAPALALGPVAEHLQMLGQ